MENTKIIPFGGGCFIGLIAFSILFQSGFWGLIGGIFLGVLFVRYFSKKTPTKRRKTKYFEGESEFMSTVLGIASQLVKSDHNQATIELKFVDLMLEKNFDSGTSLLLKKQFRNLLKKNLDLDWLCSKVTQEFDSSGRIQLMQFLCGIATCDGLLSDTEYRFLLNVGQKIRMPFLTFKSILALFNFRTEQQQRAHKQRFHQKKTRTYTSQSQLKLAYDLLEINEEASDAEVKKAYRDQAKKHHPDRVIHMGKEFQKMAKERFQKIQKAYELIKSKRGFS